MDDDTAATPPEGPPQFDRRRGPRRAYSYADPVTGERRTHDRRKTPGVEALFDRLLGVRETLPAPADVEPESDAKP